MAKRLKAEDRRQQILHAAVRVFARCGYRGATTAQLARAARVSEPVLYRHFDSKQSLFLALLEWAGEEAVRRFMAAIGPVQSPIEQLRVLLRLNPATSDPQMAELYRVVFHAQSEHLNPRIQAALSRHYRRYATFLTEIIARAQAAGQVRKNVSAEGLAWQLIHVAVGFAMIKPLAIPGHATVEAVEQSKALLMEELTGPERTPVARAGPATPFETPSA